MKKYIFAVIVVLGSSLAWAEAPNIASGKFKIYDAESNKSYGTAQVLVNTLKDQVVMIDSDRSYKYNCADTCVWKKRHLVETEVSELVATDANTLYITYSKRTYIIASGLETARDEMIFKLVRIK